MVYIKFHGFAGFIGLTISWVCGFVGFIHDRFKVLKVSCCIAVECWAFYNVLYFCMTEVIEFSETKAKQGNAFFKVGHKPSWNHDTHETYDTRKPMKQQNVWNHKPIKPGNLWNHKTYETTKSMKPMKPRNVWNHEIYETMKPMKPRTLRNNDTHGTYDHVIHLHIFVVH